MSSFEELHLSPLLAGRLAEWGWNASQREARDAAATAARGNNLVIQAPPTPAWAAPALAGLLSRAESRPALLLAPDSELGEWGALAQLLARETGWRVLAPEGEARAAAKAMDWPWLPRVAVTTPANCCPLRFKASM